MREDDTTIQNIYSHTMKDVINVLKLLTVICLSIMLVAAAIVIVLYPVGAGYTILALIITGILLHLLWTADIF